MAVPWKADLSKAVLLKAGLLEAVPLQAAVPAASEPLLPNPALAPMETSDQEQAQALADEPGSATVAAALAGSVPAQRDDRVGPHGRTG